MRFLKSLLKFFLYFLITIGLGGLLCLVFFNHYISSKPNVKISNTPPQKILIITGELSGEKLALWYLDKLTKKYKHLTIHALGKDLLTTQKEIYLHPEFDSLRKCSHFKVKGFLEHIKNFPHLYNLFQELATFIMTNNFDHVILVDFPSINIPLARKIKQKKPTIHLTYIAPPELWIWGRWGIDHLLKNNLDKIIVLYPAEKAWYHSIGLDVEWHGYPFYHELTAEKSTEQKKEKCIALIPGSRKVELDVMLPILNNFVEALSKKHPEVAFVLPLAESFSYDFMQEMLNHYGLSKKITIIAGDEKKKEVMSRCFLAITKPGTITLQLALLKVPMIITYKVPWLNYLILKNIIQTKFVGLPNLFASQEICKELLQDECTPEMLVHEADMMYKAFLANDQLYQKKLDALEALRESFQISENNVTQYA